MRGLKKVIKVSDLKPTRYKDNSKIQNLKSKIQNKF